MSALDILKTIKKNMAPDSPGVMQYQNITLKILDVVTEKSVATLPDKSFCRAASVASIFELTSRTSNILNIRASTKISSRNNNGGLFWNMSCFVAHIINKTPNHVVTKKTNDCQGLFEKRSVSIN
jgi:hypothetical protein